MVTGGKVVSVLASKTNDLSSNCADVNSIYLINCTLKRGEMIKNGCFGDFIKIISFNKTDTSSRVCDEWIER